MLTLDYDKETGAPKLLISNPFAVAWISHDRRLTPDFHHVNEVHNRRLWVQRRPDQPPRAGKSPTGLLIESHLRAWLLQRFRRRLSDLVSRSFWLSPRAKKNPVPRDTGWGRIMEEIRMRISAHGSHV